MKIKYKYLSVLLLFLTTNPIFSKTIKVAVVDTGIMHEKINGKNVLCDHGHKDFTGYGLEDINGHGTNISGIIHKKNSNKDYCQIIVKYYDDRIIGKKDMQEISNMALKYAISLNVDIINYSSYGAFFDTYEQKVLKELINKNIFLVVPSGNMPINLDFLCIIFPACLKKNNSHIIVVGASDNKYNYGYGSIVDEYLPSQKQEGFGIVMSGTSQSTAHYTANWIFRRAKNK